LWYYRHSSDAKVGPLSLKYWDNKTWVKLTKQETQKKEPRDIDEQGAFNQCLSKYRGGKKGGIGQIKKISKSGRINYPIKKRDTATSCLDGKAITMSSDIRQFLFSGCENVNLTNWPGEYSSIRFNEIWVYSDIGGKIEVYWNDGRFELQIGYYDDGYINYIRDRFYYEYHPQSRNC